MSDGGNRRISRRMAEDLDRLRGESQLRTLEIPNGINLCSNDYLGLAGDPRLKRAAIEAVSRAEMVGSTGSRLLSGNSREWEELESDFARFFVRDLIAPRFYGDVTLHNPSREG